MPSTTNRDGDAHDGEELAPPHSEPSRRTLYWWHVPERPGVGKDMLIFIGAWFATLLALAIVIGAIVAVAA